MSESTYLTVKLLGTDYWGELIIHLDPKAVFPTQFCFNYYSRHPKQNCVAVFPRSFLINYEPNPSNKLAVQIDLGATSASIEPPARSTHALGEAASRARSHLRPEQGRMQNNEDGCNCGHLERRK